MGREPFTPKPASELGRTYGPKPLQRRYTNVYVWEHGRWKWLARQMKIAPRQRAEEGAPGQSRAPQPISYWPASARYCAGVTGPIA